MLWFIGMGISGVDSISVKAQKILQDADVVYLERFTSPIFESDEKKLADLTKECIIAKRWMVEDGKKILDDAKKKKTVLISYGDPYIATTHIELRTRAIKEKIKTDTIHAASSLTSMIGECGLHHYKIGRVVTVMDDIKTSVTPYWVIYKNLIEGNHTVILLEYNQDKNFFLDPKDALKLLIQTEKGQKGGFFDDSIFAIVASRIGFADQSIVAGKVSSLQKYNFGGPPHTIIIPGKVHFTESDALAVLAKCLDEFSDNSNKTKKISHQMIAKYVPMVRAAIEEIAPYYNSKESDEIIENARLYVKDAENFLQEGKDEVAILSIGYADGLVDALRISQGLEPKM